MNNEITLIPLIHLEIVVNEEEISFIANETEHLSTLNNGADFISTLFVESTKTFMDDILEFMTSRANIIVNDDSMAETIFENTGLAFDLCINKESRAEIFWPDFNKVFETYKSKVSQEHHINVDFFKKIVELEIHDFEDDMTININNIFALNNK